VKTEEIRRNLRMLARARVPWGIVCALALVQAWITLGGGTDRMGGWYETLGLRRETVLSGGVWQILTHGLLHGGWPHLAVNALCVILLGAKIEHITGPSGLVKLAGLGVLGGGIGHLLLAPGGPDAPVLVGFSGAVVAMLLWITTVSPESRMWPLPVSGRALGLGILTSSLFLALVHPDLELPGFSLIGRWLAAHGLETWFEIGHACHFGGGITGWLAARWTLRPRPTLKSLRRQRERQEAGIKRR
jgi:membrane associated rhomboid family serine protease